MKILTQLNQDNTPRTPALAYRARLSRKAKALLEAQSNGKCLRNQQRRLVARWQQVEARKREKAA